MLHEDLMAAQRHMELDGRKKGAEKYLKDQTYREKREGLSHREDSQKVIRSVLPLVAAEITKWKQGVAEKAGVGRTHSAYAPLSKLDDDQLALIALSGVFQGIVNGKSLPDTDVRLGATVEVELEALAMKTQSPKDHKALLKLAAKDSSEKSNLRRHEKAAERLEVRLNWEVDKKARVGEPLIEAVLKGAPDVFARGKGSGALARQEVIELTDTAIDAMAAMTELQAWMRPKYLPMVVPPRPWEAIDTGCYYEPEVAKTVPLIRTRSYEHKKLVKAAIADGSMARVLAVLNKIQNTPFAIDTRVLEIVKWARTEGHHVSKSFPLPNVPETPTKHKKEEWEAFTAEKRAALSRQRKSVREIRLAAVANTGVFNSDILTAEDMAQYEAFWLPHSLDFRGRVYPVPSFNHQRSDHIKAMFLFADAMPLGPSGGEWLMVHIANCADWSVKGRAQKTSKWTFDERIQWVKDNETLILLAAQDPKETYGWWAQADKPFCFLQGCFEYAAWAQSGFSEHHESRLAIGLDGSCSGLQHYSAMMRAEEEARHVNLLPREDVGDIYQVVADTALPTIMNQTTPEWLEREIATATRLCTQSPPKGNELTLDERIEQHTAEQMAARKIIEVGFGRKTVKRNVMTKYYGSATHGMRDQHMTDTMKPLQDDVLLGKKEIHPYAFEMMSKDKKTGKVTRRPDGGFQCAYVLAKHIHSAVKNVAPKADRAAEWFQDVAGVLAHEGKSVIWTTPMGLPVVHRYSEYDHKKVNLWLYDRSVLVVPPSAAASAYTSDEEGRVSSRFVALLRTSPTKRINKLKARSAMAPNLVHSLDGSHLMRTVEIAAEHGIEDFLLIHDSFATHLGATDAFFALIREAFVWTYETYCPFEALDTYARSVLEPDQAAQLPVIPEKGNLDLNMVRESLYAFA